MLQITRAINMPGQISRAMLLWNTLPIRSEFVRGQAISKWGLSIRGY